VGKSESDYDEREERKERYLERKYQIEILRNNFSVWENVRK
jgi:hypothetical protein